jgi:hypothetical protein
LRDVEGRSVWSQFSLNRLDRSANASSYGF